MLVLIKKSDIGITAYSSPGRVFVGRLAIVPGPTRCYLWNLNVIERYRRKGIASRLMMAAFRVAKELGFKEVEFDTHISNQGAIQLYHKLGCFECRRRLGGKMFMKRRL